MDNQTPPTKIQNLGEAALSEIERVSSIAAIYESLPGGAGLPAASIMRHFIKQARECLSNGDTVGLITFYNALKDFEE